VDTRHKLIAEQQFHNKVSDLGLLTETAEAAGETLGVDKIDAVADRGYFKIEDIEACEAAGIVAYVPKPQRGSAVAKGFFGKEQFRYDAEADTYICPGGAALRRGRSRPVRDDVRLFEYTLGGVEIKNEIIALAELLTKSESSQAGPRGGPGVEKGGGRRVLRIDQLAQDLVEGSKLVGT
jgi:hypothetical protein